jgi:hypothetical protein
MGRNILIVTTAHLEPKECSEINMDFASRIEEYKNSFEILKNFSNFFDEVVILETRVKENFDYLEQSGFRVFYSQKENTFLNKGMNEISHLIEIIKNIESDEEDFIYKMSGRYKLQNLNINEYNDFDCVAKDDSDIYPNLPTGVHTFWFKIKIKLLKDFYKYVGCENQPPEFKTNICIEWELFNFMKLNKRCLILPPQKFLGIQTCVYDGKNWIKRNV